MLNTLSDYRHARRESRQTVIDFQTCVQNTQDAVLPLSRLWIEEVTAYAAAQYQRRARKVARIRLFEPPIGTRYESLTPTIVQEQIYLDSAVNGYPTMANHRPYPFRPAPAPAWTHKDWETASKAVRRNLAAG